MPVHVRKTFMSLLFLSLVITGSSLAPGEASAAFTPFPCSTVTCPKPSINNTGVPAALVPGLVTVNGDMTITTANTTISNRNVLGRIIVKAANVKIENTIVRGEQFATTHTVPFGLIQATDSAVTNLEISNVEVVPTVPSEWTVGFDGHDANIQKSYFHDLMDGMRLRNGSDGSSDMLVQRNRIKDLTYYVVPEARAYDKQTHNDGIQLAGAKNAVISWNNISAYYSTTAGQGYYPTNATVLPSGAANLALSAIMLNVEHSTAQLQVSGLELKHNWIGGGYQAVNAGDPGLAGANLGAITENLFDDGDASQTPLRFIQSQTVTTTPNNTYETDGSTVVPAYTA